MRLAAAVAVVLLTAGCTGGSDDGATPANRATTTPPGAATATGDAAATAPDPTCTQFHGTEGPLQSSGDRPAALLVGADVEMVGCLDRVTFEFESLGDGTPPGYTVGYRDLAADPIVTATGRELSLPAPAALVVTITPASSTDVRVAERPATYRGNLRLSYGETHHIEIVQKLDDTADAVVWAIGVDGVRPFVVDSAVGPTRVSVYIG